MHSIVFKNAQSDWNEALPLGNGVFGGMAYFQKNQYQLALNHYEVYYTMYHRYSHRYQAEQKPVSPGCKRAHYEEMLEAARRNSGDYTKEDYLHYRRTIWPTADIPRQKGLYSGQSHPPTGEVALNLSEKLKGSQDYSLRLDIEDAAVRLKVRHKEREFQAETIALADSDTMLTKIRQTEEGLLESLTFTYPQRRNHEGFSIRWEQKGPALFLCHVSFYPVGEDRVKYPPFSFVVLHHLAGAEGISSEGENQLTVRLTKSDREFYLLSHVITELSEEKDLPAAALSNVRNIAAALPQRRQIHKRHWKSFFGRSAVYLPDKIVEKLWYLNLYVLGCCSGRKGRRPEHASGLNGLWDIRQPTIWGSLWYWDVNIEASYWPVYTANHLELAEAFNDGFLSYTEQAARRASELYGMRGYAMDYPHEFYNCMWPWCAQYLWWYYEYTRDVDFLREKAYPVFYNLALFIEDVMQYDEESGSWSFFPDVSPEQGPITRNSTITIATVKYMLQKALEANRIIGGADEDARLFQRLLDRMPPYSTATLDRYGKVLKDSELAPAGIRLRHPSLLMPIYPLYELGLSGEEEERRLARNTVFFASENTEIGVFPFGWISAAAARLGMGNTALRVLYEQGLDLIIRANGMGAEETDRWRNHCVVNSGHFYHPFMMECVGEVVNCVNEMLMQSFDGVIRLFPAVPNGDLESFRCPGREKPPFNPWGEKEPVRWLDCGFDNLLAKGGFEVSARMKDGAVCWASVKSLYGGAVSIQMPDGLLGLPVQDGAGGTVATSFKENVLSFETKAGGVYTIGRKPDAGQADDEEVHCYTTHLGRKNFIGKTRNTDTFKLIDAFLYDYYVANDRYHPVTSYRFNFGTALEEIEAAKADCPPESLPRCAAELQFIKITPSEQWSACLGFGFTSQKLRAADSKSGEYLLRDAIEGEEPASFLIELPKGQYDLLAVSGSAQKPCCTQLSAGQYSCTIETAAGEYRAEILPVVHKEDGVLELKLAAAPGSVWSLSLLVVRKVLTFL